MSQQLPQTSPQPTASVKKSIFIKVFVHWSYLFMALSAHSLFIQQVKAYIDTVLTWCLYLAVLLSQMPKLFNMVLYSNYNYLTFLFQLIRCEVYKKGSLVFYMLFEILYDFCLHFWIILFMFLWLKYAGDCGDILLPW